MSSLQQEMELAVATASVSDSKNSRKIMLVDSELPTLIPSGSLLTVKSVKFTELKMGDVVCIRGKQKIEVRRYVKQRVTATNTLLAVAKENSAQKEFLPRELYLGKVESVEVGGRAFDPKKQSNPLRNFWDKLTEYGTHKPFGLG